MQWNMFFAGCVGAIAPEIVRLYEMRRETGLTFSKFYFIVSLAYILLGGYIASIFPGLVNEFYAVCVGAGLVLVVNKMVSIGGRLAGAQENATKVEPPAAPKNESVEEEAAFPRRGAAPTPRPATFMDYARAL